MRLEVHCASVLGVHRPLHVTASMSLMSIPGLGSGPWGWATVKLMQ